ncbi:hypothetical protein BSKO_08051 [Bryopsis sp. KO-2023]|nr:hypothetical protein BSKO_08051 [Bryopsis sp. KO-2023]
MTRAAVFAVFLILAATAQGRSELPEGLRERLRARAFSSVNILATEGKVTGKASATSTGGDAVAILNAGNGENKEVISVVGDETETDDQSVDGPQCLANEFIKSFAEPSCMACDVNCAVECTDGEGCLLCTDGFFTVRQDPTWPLECGPCTMENCAVCGNGVFVYSPQVCIECVPGFELVSGGFACVPSDTGVPSFPPTTVPDGEIVEIFEQSVGSPCPAGFFFKPFDGTCMECDENCLPDQCLDDVGCQACQDGFFTSKEDLEWPTQCKPCDIADCVQCRDDIFDAWPTQCVVCEEGFELGVNQEECVATSLEIFDQSVGETDCGENSFIKEFDGGCMECDVNCIPDLCVDGDGCLECQPGFFRSSPDPEWPFTCVSCDIPNCEQCVDGIFDAWPVKCDRCEIDFRISADGSECISIF